MTSDTLRVLSAVSIEAQIHGQLRALHVASDIFYATKTNRNARYATGQTHPTQSLRKGSKFYAADTTAMATNQE